MGYLQLARRVTDRTAEGGELDAWNVVWRLLVNLRGYFIMGKQKEGDDPDLFAAAAGMGSGRTVSNDHGKHKKAKAYRHAFH